jgi:NADH dehydrogenase (ubiquinone) Fe-S protein 1
MQIGTYVEQTLKSELSGNIIDLCPVGALTSKPYAFTTRPWELKSTESVDVSDAVGSNIRIDSRGLQVMRILPKINDDINEEWISDKTRFSYDGLTRQRLSTPLVRKDGALVAASWEEALETVASAMTSIAPSDMVAVAGQLADAESMTALKDLFNRLGSENLRLDGSNTDSLPCNLADFRSNYTMNSTINGVEEADALLIIGSNPRHEAAIINSRIRKSWLAGLNIGVVGKTGDLNYDYASISSPAELPSHAFMKVLASAKKPMIIVGSSVLESSDSANLFGSISRLASSLPFLQTSEWNGYNVLQRVFFIFILTV